MEPFAYPEDVETVWGELTADDTSKVEAWLAEASRKLRLIARKRGVDIDALIARDSLGKESAKDAVVNAVVRVLKNPGGYRQISTGEGPFTDSVTLDTTLSKGAIYISSDDLIGLLPSGKNRVKSFRLKAGLL